MLTPRTPAPKLDVPLVGGGRWRLADQSPRLFTMVVWYRGYHCPQCRKQLSEMNRRLGELAEVGVTSVVAISGDTEDAANKSVQEWRLDHLPVGYGVSTDEMRRWNLFISKAVKDGEPSEFGEPAVFFVQPDGSVYAELLASMPFGRPRLDDLLTELKFIGENDYPARGEA